MFVRIVRSKVQPGKADEALEFFQSGVLSSMKTREGFVGALVFLNREASESLGLTYWQDAQTQVGSYVRLNDMIAAVQQIDATVAYVRDTVVPTGRAIGGYRATLVGVNRFTGRILAATVWASAADWARQADEAVLAAQRQQADKISQAQWVHLTEYETVFAEVSGAAEAFTTAAPV